MSGSGRRSTAPGSETEAIGALADQLEQRIGALRKGERARARGPRPPTPRPAPAPAPEVGSVESAPSPGPTGLHAAGPAANGGAADFYRVPDKAPPARPLVESRKPRRSAAEQLQRKATVRAFAIGIGVGMGMMAMGVWLASVRSDLPTDAISDPATLAAVPAAPVSAAATPPEPDAPPVAELPDVAAAPPAPEPAPPTPAVPAAPRVLVSVNAQPWAVIRVDGEEIGETPIAEHPLSAGAHEFEATLPDGRVLRRTVDVRQSNAHVAFP